VPQCLDGNPVELGKFSDFEFDFRCLRKLCAVFMRQRYTLTLGTGQLFRIIFFRRPAKKRSGPTVIVNILLKNRCSPI